MTTNTATADRAADFIEYLLNHPQELGKLQDATATEIIQAGKNADYDFTESDLNTLIHQTPPVLRTAWHGQDDGSCGWKVCSNFVRQEYPGERKHGSIDPS